MKWSELLSQQRCSPLDGEVLAVRLRANEDFVTSLRTDFHVDYDRVVFSSAFRRLARKTQVHPVATHDHIHNRLTHSLEVASVGRSLGNRVGAALREAKRLPGDMTAFDLGAIVQVACLAHDIGNPPFGHTGEDAVRDWFRDRAHSTLLEGLSTEERLDITTFEGNAQGFRIVASLEMYAAEGGMRLTSAVIGTMLKYPWSSNEGGAQGKFSIYQAELPYFRMVAAQLGLPERHKNCWVRHPLSYLVEAADDICYAILDLEDAVEMGILDMQRFEALLTPLVELESTGFLSDARQRCAHLRGLAIGRCVAAAADCFVAHEPALLDGGFQANDLLAVCPAEISETLLAAKALAYREIYQHHSKLVTEIAAYGAIRTLLDTVVPSIHALATDGVSHLTPRQRLQLRLLNAPLAVGSSVYEAYLSVLDWLGAMTDNTAARTAREVSGIGLLS